MPIVSKCLEMFEENLPNPVLLIVVRNPFGVAKSLIKHDPDYNADLKSYHLGISKALHDYSSFSKSMLNLNSPFIIVEHEKIIANPKLFIREFVEVLNVKTDLETVDKAIKFISSPGYKRIEDLDKDS